MMILVLEHADGQSPIPGLRSCLLMVGDIDCNLRATPDWHGKVHAIVALSA